MKIELTNAGKRFNREWIFRGFTHRFCAGKAYAITGPNGSGKSTLLQAVGGMLQLSEGTVGYSHEEGGQAPRPVPGEEAYRHISFCAPYLEVIEEMTLQEFLAFHQQFKPLLPSMTIENVMAAIGLSPAANKQIRHYSSGMKQRVKLAQAVFSASSVVLLDEPCSNLDATGIALYHSLISNYCRNRLVVVSSNDETEYRFCDEVISILEYKKG